MNGVFGHSNCAIQAIEPVLSIFHNHPALLSDIDNDVDITEV